MFAVLALRGTHAPGWLQGSWFRAPVGWPNRVACSWRRQGLGLFKPWDMGHTSLLVEGYSTREAWRMARTKWNDLSPRTKKMVLVGGSVEAALKVAALVDLARRPPSEIRGKKRNWVLAVVLLNSVGIAPLAYFLRGRKPAGS